MSPSKHSGSQRKHSGRALAIALLALLLSGLVPEAFAASTSTSQTAFVAPKTCLDGGTAGTVPPDVSVAMVKPIFTATPYSQYPTGSFYAFYKKYHATGGNITTNLDWLNTSVRYGNSYNSGWGATSTLRSFMMSDEAKRCGLELGRNLSVVSDINITQGALFTANGTRRFDAIVMGHEEYVTQNEYDQIRLFVHAGGRLIAMSANLFYVRVTYNPRTSMETFVVGHKYAYNGISAWHSTAAPFDRNASWTGGNYCCFHKFQYKGAQANSSNPIGSDLLKYFGGGMALGYVSHEENAVANLSQTSVVAKFLNQSGLLIASYVHRYGKGAVFCLCVFGEDLVAYDPSTQYFLVASVTAAMPEVTAHAGREAVSAGSIPSFSIVTFALAGLVVPIVMLLEMSRAVGQGPRGLRRP
jgi:hypothetical protein